jgi:hypothetical protein
LGADHDTVKERNTSMMRQQGTLIQRMEVSDERYKLVFGLVGLFCGFVLSPLSPFLYR